MTTNYTDPALRDRLKAKVKKGSKGGKKGQWSAIKSLILSKLYKSEMKKKGKAPFKSGYTKKQSALKKWVKEDWQTSKGSKNARTKRGNMQRYLPKKKWQNMSTKAKKKTNAKKLRGSRRGKQYVSVQ